MCIPICLYVRLFSEHFLVQRRRLVCHDRRRLLRDRDRPPLRPGVEDRDHGLPEGLRDGPQPLDGSHRPRHRRPDGPTEDGVQEGDVRAHGEQKDEDSGL